MQFNTFERLVLLNVLSQGGSGLADLKIVHNLKMSLSLTPKEQKDSKMKFLESGNVNADWLAVKPKDIKLCDRSKEIIAKGLKKMGEQEQLTEEHFTLCEKFKLFEEEKK
ncbi:hypothetical protein ES708_07286 [subsurface metagenome]